MSAAADSSVAIVLTTLGAGADAGSLARTLLEERLAACVNILPPMISCYRWKDAIEEDLEQQLVIKTTPERVDALARRLQELHHYELPELIVLDARASEAYGTWVGESVSARGDCGGAAPLDYARGSKVGPHD